MKKNLIRLSCVLLVLCLGTTIAVATGLSKKIQAYLRPDVPIVIDGETQTFTDVNGAVVYPVQYNGTTYLPIRAIAGLMGKDVSWDEATQTVSLKSPSTDLGGAVVYEDRKVCIRYSKTYYDQKHWLGASSIIVFTIENKTDAELTFQSSAIAMDGISYNGLSGSDVIAPKSTGTINFRYEGEIPSANISKISGTISVIDFAADWRDASYDAKFLNVNVS